MTRKECIKWLKSLKTEIGKSEHQELWHYAEAIDKVIEALSAEAVDIHLPDYSFEAGMVQRLAKFVHGKWNEDCACSVCGCQPWYEHDIHTLNFCPNCGADMRGSRE